jgi:hypothetical protein
MQSVGFIMMFVLFLICGVAFNTLTATASGLRAFQFLYFFSSFWNQFGPNCTTWLVAGGFPKLNDIIFWLTYHVKEDMMQHLARGK